MRLLNLVMVGLFVFGALVQLNDPDPLLWAGIYLVAAGVGYMANREPGKILLPAAVGVVSGVWAAMLASGATVPVTGLFKEWEMRDDTVEVSREFYGLIIIAVWMVVLVIRGLMMRGTTAGVAASRPA